MRRVRTPTDHPTTVISARIVRGARLWLCAALLTGLPHLALPATTITTVGDPIKRKALLQTDILAAVSAGYTFINVNPGAYQIKAGAVMTLNNLTSVTIDGEDANGVAQVSVTPGNMTTSAIKVTNCTSLVLRGFNLGYPQPQTVQGTITAILTDNNGRPNGVSVQVHDGYGYDSNGNVDYQRFAQVAYVMSPATNLWKAGCGDSYTNTVTDTSAATGQHTCNVTLTNYSAPIAVGDYLVGRGPGAHIVVDQNCSHCTFQNLNVTNGGDFQFLDQTGNANHFTYCTVTRGAAPVAGGIAPLISSSADGFHSSSAATGPEVDHCTFEYMADDAINVVGAYAQVFASSYDPGSATESLTVGFASNLTPAGKSGDVIYLQQDPNGGTPNYFVQTTLVADPVAVSTPPGVDSRYSCYQWTTPSLPQAIPTQGNVLAYDANYVGSNFSVHDNVVNYNRARGIRIAADNGSIVNNTVTGSTIDAIRIADAIDYRLGSGKLPDLEAGLSHNLVVQGNRIRSTGLLAPAKDAAVNVAPTASTSQNIQILGNFIEGVYGANIQLQNTSGDVITDNVIDNPQSLPSPSAVDFTPFGNLISYDDSVTPPVEARDAVQFEGESLSIIAQTPGIVPATVSDGNCQSGAYLSFPAVAAGNYLALLAPNVTAGSYGLTVGARTSGNCGAWQTAVGQIGVTPTTIGAVYNEFSNAVSYPEFSAGEWTVSPNDNNPDKQVQFTVVNSSGGGNTIAVDYIRLYALTALEIWRGANFGGTYLSVGAAADSAAPFGDGVPNLVKYAFNLNVQAADATPMTPLGQKGLPLMGLDGVGRLTLTYVRRKAAAYPGIVYQPLFGSALSSLAVNPQAVTSDPTPIDDTWERVVVTDSSTTGPRFGRVVITSQ